MTETPMNTYSPDMFCVDISQKCGQRVQYYTEDTKGMPLASQKIVNEGLGVLTDAGYSNI